MSLGYACLTFRHVRAFRGLGGMVNRVVGRAEVLWGRGRAGLKPAPTAWGWFAWVTGTAIPLFGVWQAGGFPNRVSA